MAKYITASTAINEIGVPGQVGFGVWPFAYWKRLYLADNIRAECDWIYTFRGKSNR